MWFSTVQAPRRNSLIPISTVFASDTDSYIRGLTLLRDYDEGRIDATPTSTPDWKLTPDEARTIIANAAVNFPKTPLRQDELRHAGEAHASSPS